MTKPANLYPSDKNCKNKHGKLSKLSCFKKPTKKSQTLKDPNSSTFKLTFHISNEPHHEKACFCICENKDPDQLRRNHAADQCLRFRYTNSSIPLLPKSEISRLWSSSVAVQPGLCRTNTDFLMTRLILRRPKTKY